ncbi:beta-galactosidase trimerization domain-containing protein [bacterium]|nr:beta-galactosidase trimerization domain-containing protein [bacterium]
MTLSTVHKTNPILLTALVLTVPLLFFACAPSKMTDEPDKRVFSMKSVRDSCTIDGRLDEAVWKEADRLGAFRVDADPAKIPMAQTHVSLAYDSTRLFVAFVCEEPMMKQLKADSASGNTGAWDKDYCEICLFSRPETPYYSPFMQRLDYMNAREETRTMRHFLVSPTNNRHEGNVYKVGSHTPYIVDDAWDCNWQSSVGMQGDRYVIEIAIPWDSIGGHPKPGHTFMLNFIRNRQSSGNEISCFNWYSDENIRVRPFSSAGFIQEYPTIFASTSFMDDHAVITRFVETKDPWAVDRPVEEYERVLTGRPVPLRAAHFYLGLRSFLIPDRILNLYDKGTWAAEEQNLLTETGRAGMNGPFLPGFMNTVGVSGLDSLYRSYGMKFSLHPYINSNEAKKAGATIITPGGTAAFFDPVHMSMKEKMLKNWLSKYGKEPWLFDIRGQDEPFNQIASILQPGTIDRVKKELRDEFGVELDVPAGIPDVPYQNQQVHKVSLGVPDQKTALSRIAVFRWLNRAFAGVARGEYAIVRTYAPGKLYQAYNRNSVADLDFLDQSMVYDYTDYYSADPYPSFCMLVYGGARTRYHVGFTSKFVTDMAAGKPTQMIVQGCEMIQRLSTVENVREWASQAAKAGVTMIDWWGTPRLNYPDVYREMLRLSRLWKELPALDIPSSSDIAVLFSDDSRAAAGDEALHGHYTLHVILGEKLGAWFTYVSENHVRKGLHTLNGKKLIIAPQLGYVSRSFAENLIGHVEQGATLVVLDPDALTWDIMSGPLTDQRMKLLGIPDCSKREAAEMLPGSEARTRFKIDAPLPCRPLRIVGDTMNARVLDVPGDAKILFTYSDGSPAAYTRPLGKGEVIVFGAMPFQDSECAIASTPWEKFFATLIDEQNIKRDLPIWKFMFPKTGGEVETIDLLVKIPPE